jgi:hypothetical protein
VWTPTTGRRHADTESSRTMVRRSRRRVADLSLLVALIAVTCQFLLGNPR